MVQVHYKDSAMAEGNCKVREILNVGFIRNKFFKLFSSPELCFLGVSQWIHFETGFCIPVDGKN